MFTWLIIQYIKVVTENLESIDVDIPIGALFLLTIVSDLIALMIIGVTLIYI